MDTTRLAELKKQADTFTEYWKLTVSDYPPDYKQWFIWLGAYTPEVIEKGIAAMAMKHDLHYRDRVRYASACMRNIKAGTLPPAKKVSHA